MNKYKVLSMLNDISLRLTESTKYEMVYVEKEINDCVHLIEVIKEEVIKNSTDTV